MWKWFLSLPALLAAQAQLEPQSMLHQAEWIAKKYNFEVAKAAPPLLSPQPQSCLTLASNWFSLDLSEIEAPAFDTLNNDLLWDMLREIGVQAVYLRGLKEGGQFRTGMSLDPKWGKNWDDLAITLQKKGMVLIGDTMGGSTGLCADFCLALKNVGDYPGLYHLVEVEKFDWKLLPQVPPTQFAANIPWLALQQLHKKGYVPEQFAPYVKESRWNATGQIKCADGKVRRWIYLKENELDPVIDWLNPSFAGARIATADVLDSIYRLGEKIVRLDGSMSDLAKETLSLWSRKLGAYSVQEGKKGLDEMKGGSADLITDTVTRPALLHALVAQDAEALKMMYRLFLDEGVETKRLVHVLQPFDEFSCDWAELLLHPKRKYAYYEEILTGEMLRNRLLKEDLLHLGDNQLYRNNLKNREYGKEAAQIFVPGASDHCLWQGARISQKFAAKPTTPKTDSSGYFGINTWPGYCAAALGICDLEKQREDVTDTHLLLAFFYAMQPGVFSFSASDLLGTVSMQTLHLMGCNENTLYASLPGQMRNRKSFAMQLKQILAVRRDNGLESGELVAVPRTKQPGLMILVHQLKGSGMLQLLAVNFGRTTAEQMLEMPAFRQTTAIDLMTSFAERKPLDSSTISLVLPPLTGKVILFQRKYYD